MYTFVAQQINVHMCQTWFIDDYGCLKFLHDKSASIASNLAIWWSTLIHLINYPCYRAAVKYLSWQNYIEFIHQYITCYHKVSICSTKVLRFYFHFSNVTILVHTCISMWIMSSSLLYVSSIYDHLELHIIGC